jgi:hypothetical protein
MVPGSVRHGSMVKTRAAFITSNDTSPRERSNRWKVTNHSRMRPL